MGKITGKIAVITGAGSGFGKEFAKEAHKRGMLLFLADIRGDAAENTAREMTHARRSALQRGKRL